MPEVALQINGKSFAYINNWYRDNYHPDGKKKKSIPTLDIGVKSKFYGA